MPRSRRPHAGETHALPSSQLLLLGQNGPDPFDLAEGDRRWLASHFDMADLLRTDPVVNGHEADTQQLGREGLGDQPVMGNALSVPLAFEVSLDGNALKQAI
jgi:hypothetical protein